MEKTSRKNFLKSINKMYPMMRENHKDLIKRAYFYGKELSDEDLLDQIHTLETRKLKLLEIQMKHTIRKMARDL